MVIKNRGAISNPSGRFESEIREAIYIDNNDELKIETELLGKKQASQGCYQYYYFIVKFKNAIRATNGDSKSKAQPG